MTKVLRHIKNLTLFLAVAIMSSCSMMTEDLPECETLVRVSFKYDYNIQRADMFHDHVGMVRLFVIDADNGTVVRDLTVSNRDDNDAIKVNDNNRYFTVTLNDLPLGRNYRFMAVALQRPYDETMAHSEDKFVGTFPLTGENADKLQMRLTRSDAADAQGRYPVTAPECGLDTLWMGHTTKPIAVPAERTSNIVICDTISMVRDTKYLSLTLRQLDAPTDIKDEQFRIEITDNNGFLAWNNKLLADDKLLYTPHAQWTSEILNSNNEVIERAAHYDISFSRLMYYMGADNYKNASLRIFRNDDNTCVADINLPSILAQGRNVFEIYGYSPQEYLDREYDYDLDLFLLNNEWQYINLKVNIAAWVIRIQRQSL